MNLSKRVDAAIALRRGIGELETLISSIDRQKEVNDIQPDKKYFDNLKWTLAEAKIHLNHLFAGCYDPKMVMVLNYATGHYEEMYRAMDWQITSDPDCDGVHMRVSWTIECLWGADAFLRADGTWELEDGGLSNLGNKPNK